MVLVLLVGFVAGVVTGVSPCILPVLPVVLVGGATSAAARRPFAIVGGLVVTFGLTVLVAGSVLAALHLPSDLLTWVGTALLLALGVGLCIPAVGAWLERPFARLAPSSQPWAGSASGFLLGMGLGLLFVPCAGPVLSAITVAAARHHVGFGVVALTAAYVAGVAVPLLVLAVVAQRTSAHWGFLRRHAVRVRQVGGVVMALMALAIFFNWTASLQRLAPGNALEERLASGSVGARLQQLRGERPNSFAARQASAASALPMLGQAPDFTGVTAWLNTPGGRPLTLAQLRGKVVLVDFWTYSCINCQRSLPHVEAWYRAYARDGLVVVGVHSPEFPFEHVVSNVRAAAGRLGVRYPVAVDDDLATWDAYNNEYWPAEYLIDQNGEVRHTDFGEGGYATTESDIRALLMAGGVHRLPPATDVPDRTPDEPQTPESYLGYLRLQNYTGSPVLDDRRSTYHLATPLPPNEFTLGGTWTVHQWEATAGSAGARLALNYEATDVYLVLGGHGTVTVTRDGAPVTTLDVHGVPDLYTVLAGRALSEGTLTLTFSPGVQAYDFTFG